jgi:hypothetical protein
MVRKGHTECCGVTSTVPRFLVMFLSWPWPILGCWRNNCLEGLSNHSLRGIYILCIWTDEMKIIHVLWLGMWVKTAVFFRWNFCNLYMHTLSECKWRIMITVCHLMSVCLALGVKCHSSLGEVIWIILNCAFRVIISDMIIVIHKLWIMSTDILLAV